MSVFVDNLYFHLGSNDPPPTVRGRGLDIISYHISNMAQTSIEFRIKYWTTWGQNLVVVGPDPRLGGWDVKKGVFMHCQVREGHGTGTDRTIASRHDFFFPQSYEIHSFISFHSL